MHCPPSTPDLKRHSNMQQCSHPLLGAAALAFLAAVLVPQPAAGFSTLPRRQGTPRTFVPGANAALGRSTAMARSTKNLHSKPSDESDSDDKGQKGMAEAFEALGALSSLDDGGDDQQATDPTPDTVDFDGAPEDEMQMYKKMYNELDQQGDKGVYESLREELGGGSAGGAPYSSIEEAIDREEAILNDADGIGSLADADDDVLIASPNIGEPDMDKFMEAAVAEALEEARSQSPDVPMSITDDKELMKEINDIFDKANEKLLASVEEMKVADKAQVRKGAEERIDITKASERRLADAEEGVSRLMDKVARETSEVADAVEELKAAQTKLNSNPLSKFAGLKEEGIAKQASFVGLLLFSLRSVTDLVQISGPNGESHLVAAGIQGVIALACGVYLLLF